MKTEKLEKGIETEIYNFLDKVSGFVSKEDIITIIKQRCGCSVGTVDRKLRSVKEKGYIISEKRGNKRFSWYRVKQGQLSLI